MRIVWLATCAALALSGCSSSVAQPVEKVADFGDTRNVRQSAGRNARPLEKPVNHAEVGRYLADKWGLRGDGECKSYIFSAMVRAMKSNDTKSFIANQQYFLLMAETIPFLDKTADARIVNKAFNMSWQAHRRESAGTRSARMRQCLVDVAEAMKNSRI